ncbi:MAG: hypothetical protein JWQ38_3806 [Flavipsychrobacter sp.]|nr:hypothetical protein [Flavipsychrobacter sp.]
MNRNSETNFFNTKAGIFSYIISSTIGLVAAIYVVLFGTGGRQFMGGFGMIMLISIYKAIRNAAQLLYVDKTTMTQANMNNPFLTLGGIIAATICTTASLCIFIPVLSESIVKGNAISIALSMFIVTVQGYCFYNCLRNVHKFLRKRTLIYSYNR